MARKHKLEEVLQALKNKGCIITGSAPITEKQEVLQLPNMEEMDKAFSRWCHFNKKQGDVVDRVDWESNPRVAKMLQPRLTTVSQVVQPPHTINWKGCQLGNGSWGKVDYLVKVHGYRVMPNVY